MDPSTELLTKVYERQGETLAKLDAFNARLDSHGRRIRSLEYLAAKVTGIVTVITTGVVVVWNIITRKTS